MHHVTGPVALCGFHLKSVAGQAKGGIDGVFDEIYIRGVADDFRDQTATIARTELQEIELPVFGEDEIEVERAGLHAQQAEQAL